MKFSNEPRITLNDKSEIFKERFGLNSNEWKFFADPVGKGKLDGFIDSAFSVRIENASIEGV